MENLDDGNGSFEAFHGGKEFLAFGADGGVGELDGFVVDAFVVQSVAGTPAGWRPGLGTGEVVEADE